MPCVKTWLDVRCSAGAVRLSRRRSRSGAAAIIQSAAPSPNRGEVAYEAEADPHADCQRAHPGGLMHSVHEVERQISGEDVQNQIGDLEKRQSP